ncbi:sigma-70 family RNA polymerase sigma factor [Acidomonas methanolica]|nr:sigma-70 family RNA polymerase sigma factor [Acidomonas methanolica]MCQ9155081.1 sigma-70 family RNA polymerase sigma factor [Acidomonas methanolica]
MSSRARPAAPVQPPAGGWASVRQGLAALLPDLRGFARFLTRDPAAADDLVQDTIVRALAAQAQFMPGTSLKAWLFTIERNAFHEHCRRHAREKEIVGDMENAARENGGENGGAPMTDQMLDLHDMLWQLPDEYRVALILVGAQELSYEEAAQICDAPLGTMKARVSRARSKLAALAGAALPDDEKIQ